MLDFGHTFSNSTGCLNEASANFSDRATGSRLHQVMVASELALTADHLYPSPLDDRTSRTAADCCERPRYCITRPCRCRVRRRPQARSMVLTIIKNYLKRFTNECLSGHQSSETSYDSAIRENRVATNHP